MFKVNVHVASLGQGFERSDPATLGSGAPLELTLQFVRNVGADDLRKAWDEGFTKNAKEQLPAEAPGSRLGTESFTHGSSEPRVRRFKRGLETGEPRECDTFSGA